jgi:hypothetical protein
VWSTPLTGIWVVWDVGELLEEVRFDVLYEVDVVDLAALCPVHFSDSTELLIGDIEVDCGENLSELLRRNLISCYLISSQSIPIFEELLHSKSRSLAEGSEPLLHLFGHCFFTICHLFP